MSGKRSTRPDAATSERVKRESIWMDNNSQFQYSMSTEKKLPVFDLLQPGSENGLTLSDLVRLTGEDERLIRRRIQAERKAGKLILSDCQHGYFLPESEEDVRRFILSMSRRSREIAMVSRAAEDALARMAGQERVVGW